MKNHNWTGVDGDVKCLPLNTHDDPHKINCYSCMATITHDDKNNLDWGTNWGRAALDEAWEEKSKGIAIVAAMVEEAACQ